jgi:hypothetical protein
MNCKEFSSVLDALARALDATGAFAARDQIKQFAKVFDAAPQSKVSNLAKCIASFPDSATTGSPNLGDIARLLSAFSDLFSKTAKSAVLTDLDIIQKLLRNRDSIEINALTKMVTDAPAPNRSVRRRSGSSLRDDLVIHYKDKLEASLGDEEKFTTVYNDLRADRAFGKPEIIALAKEMTGSGARTEDSALKKIWNRHRSLMVFKAKSRATGGRSAA